MLELSVMLFDIVKLFLFDFISNLMLDKESIVSFNVCNSASKEFIDSFLSILSNSNESIIEDFSNNNSS